MAHVLLLHHAQGLTAGVRAFADELRAAGHAVVTPDLFDGRTFESVDEGVDHAREIGFDEVTERGVRAADDLPADLVYAGFSLGAGPAQSLAQNRSGARGALLFHAAMPLGEYADAWPEGVGLQVHAMEHDPFYDNEWDRPAAEGLVAAVPGAELFEYPGDQHLFADSSLPSYDAEAASVLTRRVLEFLARS
jgi:dienelactone hydrolase